MGRITGIYSLFSPVELRPQSTEVCKDCHTKDCYRGNESVAATGATALLTGNCGPKAFQVLGQAGITVYIKVGGKVRQAIDDLKAGKLTAADGANVEGHWM